MAHGLAGQRGLHHRVDLQVRVRGTARADAHGAVRQPRRQGVAVGTAELVWKGRATVGRKVEWPSWRPTDDMIEVAIVSLEEAIRAAARSASVAGCWAAIS